MKQAHKKKFLLTGGVVLAALLLFGLWLYTGSLNNIKANVFSFLHLPIAKVSNTFITMDDLQERSDIGKKIAPAGTSVQEINTDVLDALIKNSQLAAVAKKYNVSISKKDLESEYAILAAQVKDVNEIEIEPELKTRYGMNQEQFKDFVLSSELLTNKLIAWYNGNKSLNTNTYAKMESLKQRLSRGEDFSALARQYSEDEASRDTGGDSGVITLASIHPEIASALETAQKGSITIVGSRAGLHLIEVTDISTSDNGEKQLALRQIFVKQSGFDGWFKKELESISVNTFVNF